MDRNYLIRLHREDRVGAPYRADVYAVVTPPPPEAAAVMHVQDDMGGGIGRVFELIVDGLIDHQDEHGELP